MDSKVEQCQMVEQELCKRKYPNDIKNIKTCSTSFVFEKMRNKITMRYFYIIYKNGLNEKKKMVVPSVSKNIEHWNAHMEVLICTTTLKTV